MDWKYLTKFELMNECEKMLFKAVGNGMNNFRKSTTKNVLDLGRKIAETYKSTPNFIKAGGLVALSVFGTLEARELLKEKPKEEKIWVGYRIENAPYMNPTYHSEFVNMKRLKEIRTNRYYTILNYK